jgi:hypothetical protein
MKQKIIDIVGFMKEPERAELMADEVMKLWTDFITWKDNPGCPFSLHYDGLKPKDERISYDRLQGNYTLDEVFSYYCKNVLK